MKSVSNIPLYTHSYLVATPKGYTKHYYAGDQRVCSKLGGGGPNNNGVTLMTTNKSVSENATSLLSQTFKYVSETDTWHRDMELNEAQEISCIKTIDGQSWTDILDLSKSFTPTPRCVGFSISTNPCLGELGIYAPIRNTETNVYYYHSDHLGSASWITDVSGLPLQHLQYLPYGEPFVNQVKSGYGERFTFTGKERDYELRSIREHDKNEKNNSEQTKYYYHGARFHWSDIGWLSVDPLSDKYPSTSAYMYCRGNPIILVDPNGMDDYGVTGDGTIFKLKDQSKAIEGKDRLIRANKERNIKFDMDGNLKNASIVTDEGTFAEKNFIKGSNGTILKLGTDRSKSLEIFEFMSNNTFIEYGLVEQTDGHNYIGTSHERSWDDISLKIAKGFADEGIFKSHIHNHPGKNPQASDDDFNFRNGIRIKQSGIQNDAFRIYIKGSGYKDYERNHLKRK